MTIQTIEHPIDQRAEELSAGPDLSSYEPEKIHRPITVRFDGADQVLTSDNRANQAPQPSRQDQVQYVPAESGPVYWGPGDQLRFLITGKETGGAFFLAELSVPPGGGPPPHIHHRESESFHVLEGTLTIQVGEITILASPGDFAYLPRGVVHCFKNAGDVNAKALVLVTPAGLENFFAESFDPAADRSGPPPHASAEMIRRLLAAAPGYGLEFLPPA